MRDPTKAKNPQPKTYGGQHWADPNNERVDYGGVHINSGITNHCFYLLSEKIGVDNAVLIFYHCLLRLSRNSDFIDFRNTITELAGEVKAQMVECLNDIGLTERVVSDWRKSPMKNRRLPPAPRPEKEKEQEQEQNRPSKRQRLEYPNPHIPYIQSMCCPHCLCLQPR